MTSNLVDWVFGLAVSAIGVLNLFLVHPVPGIACLLLSLVYVAPVRAMLENTLRVPIPPAARIILGLVVVWFTLGVSDLGDMID